MTAIYLFSFFKMFLVIMPVFVPFLQGLGLSMAQVMQSQAIFALTVALAEIPTGYFADRFGRKMSIFCGAVLCGLCFTGLIFVQNFTHVLIYEVMIGIAMGLISGADIALLYDQLHRTNPGTDEASLANFNKASSKAFANLQLALLLGESIAALASGFLAVKEWSVF
jgi:MFS family permease